MVRKVKKTKNKVDKPDIPSGDEGEKLKNKVMPIRV